MRLFYRLLSLILPGISHIALGFCGRGVVFFCAYAFLIDGAFLSYAALMDESIKVYIWGSCLAVAFLINMYIFRDIWHLTRTHSHQKWKDYVQDRLQKAIMDYLKDDFTGARDNLEKVLKKDNINVNAYFYSGLLYRQQGNEKKAVKCFQKCLLLDPESKWREAIESFYNNWQEREALDKD